MNSVLTATEVVLDRMEDGLIVNTASLAGILKVDNKQVSQRTRKPEFVRGSTESP